MPQEKTAYYKERIKNCLELEFYPLIPYWERKLKQAQEDSMDKVIELNGGNGFKKNDYL